ncbi:response regulator [Geobacter sp.]|uniref:response regulator n=1 Tax=Geobacter sp. TaxID=46610 RepID=UPI00359F15DE
MVELKRILLVEDSPYDAELTLEALGEVNLANKVDHVRDGEEALDYLFRRGRYADRPVGNPVLVLLDLKLPKVDGHEVLRAIRTDETLRTMPVVILTSSREECDLVEGYANGVNAYVVKPVEFKEFVSAVKEMGIFWAVINEPPVCGR